MDNLCILSRIPLNSNVHCLYCCRSASFSALPFAAPAVNRHPEASNLRAVRKNLPFLHQFLTDFAPLLSIHGHKYRNRLALFFPCSRLHLAVPFDRSAGSAPPVRSTEPLIEFERCEQPVDNSRRNCTRRGASTSDNSVHHTELLRPRLPSIHANRLPVPPDPPLNSRLKKTATGSILKLQEAT